MNVGIRSEAAQFLFEEYISQIFFAVWKGSELYKNMDNFQNKWENIFLCAHAASIGTS